MKLQQIIEMASLTNCNVCSTGIVSTKCAKCGKAVCKNCLANDTICRNCADTAYNSTNRLRTESINDFHQDNWYLALKPKEQEMIERLLSDRAMNIAPDRYREAKFFVETMASLEELMPFNGDRLRFISWWDDARKNELLTYNDKSRLTRFCIDNLYF